jgi:hypothetical protein
LSAISMDFAVLVLILWWFPLPLHSIRASSFSWTSCWCHAFRIAASWLPDRSHLLWFSVVVDHLMLLLCYVTNRTVGFRILSPFWETVGDWCIRRLTFQVVNFCCCWWPCPSSAAQTTHCAVIILPFLISSIIVNCHQALLATLYRKIAALSKGKKKENKTEKLFLSSCMQECSD